MSVNILVCTADRERQKLVERVAILGGHVTAVAANGLDALDRLTQQAIDVLLIDMRLPIMGALEAVAILRSNPETEHLRVGVFAESPTEDVVRQLVGLKVSDIILTHASHDTITSRVKSVLESADVTRLGARPDRKRLGGTTNGQPTALIVDGDAEYCTLYEQAVRSSCKTAIARSGAKALELCRKSPPDIVLIGSNLGIINREALVKWLRPLRHGEIRIIAIARKSELEFVRSTQQFDDVVARGYSPELIAKELAQIIEPMTPSGRLAMLVPNIRTTVLSAAEQTFAMMLKTDVEMSTTPTPRTASWVTAAITVKNSPFDVVVQIGFDLDVGITLAAAFLECDSEGIGQEDAVSVAGELVNVLTGRVIVALRQRKPGWEPTLPATRLGPGDDGAPTPELFLHFRALDKPIAFDISLSATMAPAERHGAGDGAARVPA